MGLGAAGAGTGHWLGQRASAVALVPLTVWFVLALLTLPSLDFSTLHAWVGEPLHCLALVLLVGASLYHSNLGTQVIAEDYVHGPVLRVLVLLLLRMLHLVLAVAGGLAIILIATKVPV